VCETRAYNRASIKPHLLSHITLCQYYRHCIELLLKIAIAELVSPTDAEHHLLDGLDRIHNLEKLSERYRDGLATWQQGVDAEAWDALMWFHGIDANAQTFRYAVDTRGVRTFTQEVTFDVNDVQRRATTAIMYLSGTINWVDECKRAAPDYRDDYF